MTKAHFECEQEYRLQAAKAALLEDLAAPWDHIFFGDGPRAGEAYTASHKPYVFTVHPTTEKGACPWTLRITDSTLARDPEPILSPWLRTGEHSIGTHEYGRYAVDSARALLRQMLEVDTGEEA